MIFPVKANPAAACSSDESRYVITNVAVQDGLMVATDGRILAVFDAPCEEGDVVKDALIPKKVAKLAVRGGSKRAFQPEMLLGESEVSVQVGADERRAFINPPITKAKFPDWRQAIPKPSHAFRVTISPELLAKLGDALGVRKGEGVTLHLNPSDPYMPMFATTLKGDRFGVIMPMRTTVDEPIEKHRTYAKAIQKPA